MVYLDSGVGLATCRRCFFGVAVPAGVRDVAAVGVPRGARTFNVGVVTAAGVRGAVGNAVGAGRATIGLVGTGAASPGVTSAATGGGSAAGGAIP